LKWIGPFRTATRFYAFIQLAENSVEDCLNTLINLLGIGIAEAIVESLDAPPPLEEVSICGG
jgi:hypothetical protein